MKYSLLDHTKAQHDVPSHHVFFTTSTAQVLTFQAGESGVWIPLPRTQGFLCSSTRCRQPVLPKAQCPLIDPGCSAEVTADQETGSCGWWKEFCCLTAPLVLSFRQVSFFQPESCMSKPPKELRHPAPHPKQRLVPPKSLLPAAQTAQREAQEWTLWDTQFRRS